MAKPKKKDNPAPATPGGVLLTLQAPGASPDGAPDPSPDDELTSEQSAELAAIDDKMENIPGDTPVEVYRYGEDGDLGFCGKMPAHVFSAAEVARRWRTAGKYRAIARIKDKKTGLVVKGGTRTKVFALDSVAVLEYAGTPAPVGAPAPAGPVGNGMELANGMAALLATVTTAMGSMITAMTSRPQGDTSLDQLDKLAGVIEKLAPKQTATLDSEMGARMVAMMNDVLDIKDRLNPPGAKDEDPLMAIARDNLPRFLGVLEAAAKRGNQSPEDARLLAAIKAKQAALPAPAPAAAPAAPAIEASPMWWLSFAKRLPFFVSLAKKDKDPVVFAMAEAELVDGTDVVGPLKQFLAADDVVDKLVGFAPELGEFRPWTEVFVSQLQESLGLIPEGSTEERFGVVEHDHADTEPCPPTCPAYVVPPFPTEEGSREASQ